MKQKHILNQLLLEHFSLYYEKNCQASINYPHVPKRQVGCHADTNLCSLHRVSLHRLKTIPTASSKASLLRGCNQFLRQNVLMSHLKTNYVRYRKCLKSLLPLSECRLWVSFSLYGIFICSDTGWLRAATASLLQPSLPPGKYQVWT